MPNLAQPERKTNVRIVASLTLDLLNAMYFTSLAGQLEGVGEWPTRTRAAMDPALRSELDLLYSYPRGQAGVMGALNDLLFVHPEAWDSVDALIALVRQLPAEGSADPAHPGIQGLAVYALRWPCEVRFDVPASTSAREAIELGLRTDIDIDQSCIIPLAERPRGVPAAILALFDAPEEVRARMIKLIQRFYDEYYRPDERRRMARLERAVAAHRREDVSDAPALARRLSGRTESCLDTVCAGDHERYIFVPSTDMGPYNSCCDSPRVHALYYQCETSAFSGEQDEEEAVHRLALLYKALSDEQRLQILRLLRDGELYAQEIVERSGIHQSVVSRHLTFLKAVGLVDVRRQNNMKFYSLNTTTGDEARGAFDALLTLAQPRAAWIRAQLSESENGVRAAD